MVICLEQGADLHIAQLMSLPFTVSCFSKILIGFSFLVPAHLGSPGQRAVKRVRACAVDATGMNRYTPCFKQEAQLSPTDRAMRLVSSNLANCHATVQKLLIRQVLTKLMV